MATTNKPGTVTSTVTNNAEILDKALLSSGMSATLVAALTLTQKQEMAKALLSAKQQGVAEGKATKRPFSMKVSDKGAVSVYGLGRFPVTLYGAQWETLLAHVDEIRSFLRENAGSLSRKVDA